MKKEFKQVSKEEFDAYAKAYPNPLDWNVAGMFEPPLGSFNDFTLGKWPETVVAYAHLMDGSAYYDGKTSEYFILAGETK